MEYTQIQTIQTQVNPGTPVDQENGFAFASPTADLNGRVDSFNNRISSYNTEVNTYNDTSVDYRKDKKDLSGLDTAIKVILFIAIAAIIAFVVLSCLPMAVVPRIAPAITAIAVAGGILLAETPETVHAVITGKVKEGEERFGPQSAELSTDGLELTSRRSTLEDQIAAHNQANPVEVEHDA